MPNSLPAFGAKPTAAVCSTKAGAWTAATKGRRAGQLLANIRASGRAPPVAVRAGRKLTKESQKMLTSMRGVRGRTVTVTLKGTYGNYSAADVVKVCQALTAGKIRRRDLVKKDSDKAPYKFPRRVPQGTIGRWMARDKVTGKRKYEALVGGGALPTNNRPMLTEEVDEFLMLCCFFAHRAKKPFRKVAIMDVARTLAIDMGVTVRRTGEPYTEATDMRGWWTAFSRRAAAKGLPLVEKQAHRIARVRVDAVTRESVRVFAEEVMRPALKQTKAALAKRGIKMGLKHVGNYDEWFLDLSAFGDSGKVLVIRGEKSNVEVPWERAKHVSVLTSFVGGALLRTAVLFPRVTISPHHGEHLSRDADGPKLALYATPDGSGWMSSDIKTDIFTQWAEDDTNIIGKVEVLMQTDGHDTNTRNLALAMDMKANMVDLVVTPAHHTHGLQPCDMQNGPIAQTKREALKLIEQHFNSNLQPKYISDAQIAWIVEEAARRVPKSVYLDSLKKVGWLVDAHGEIQYEPLAVMPAHIFSEPRPTTGTRSGARLRADPPMEAAEQLGDSTLLDRAASVVGASRRSQVPADEHATRKRGSLNGGGLAVTGKVHMAYLLQVQAEREQEAADKDAKHLDKIKKWLLQVKAADEALKKAGGDFKKLKNADLKAFIHGRAAKQPAGKAASKDAMVTTALTLKDQHVILGNCAVCKAAGINFAKGLLGQPVANAGGAGAGDGGDAGGGAGGGEPVALMVVDEAEEAEDQPRRYDLADFSERATGNDKLCWGERKGEWKEGKWAELDDRRACEAGAECQHLNREAGLQCYFCNVVYHLGCPGAPEGRSYPPLTSGKYATQSRRVGQWWCPACDKDYTQAGGTIVRWARAALAAAIVAENQQQQQAKK